MSLVFPEATELQGIWHQHVLLWASGCLLSPHQGHYLVCSLRNQFRTPGMWQSHLNSKLILLLYSTSTAFVPSRGMLSHCMCMGLGKDINTPLSRVVVHLPLSHSCLRGLVTVPGQSVAGPIKVMCPSSHPGKQSLFT